MPPLSNVSCVGSVSSISSESSLSSLGSEGRVSSVNSVVYSAVLPPSLMVFLFMARQNLSRVLRFIRNPFPLGDDLDLTVEQF